ncbi:MAG: hypothetical protein M3Q93_01600 [Gemmatimonadota bacterium]|nr:hypothetical protein [Gemmatimonadota bacterium]
MTAPLWAAAVAHRDGGVLDGVHLLWAPPAGAGYSVQGFDIQRRRSQRRPEPQCFTLGAAELAQLHQRFVLATPLGELSVRDAACPRLPTSLPDEPFQDEEPPAPSERVCVEFGKRAEGKSPNPLDEQGLRFTSFEPPGVPAPAIVLRSMGGIVGLDIARRLTIELAAPALEVELELIGFAGPVLVAALDAQGQVVAQARTSSPSGAAEVVVLGAPGIITVAIDAPADETLLLSVCYRGTTLPCIDFRDIRPGKASNPRLERGVEFEALARDGTRLATTLVTSIGGLVGLELGVAMRIRFPRADAVELMLLSRESAVSILARRADGRIVAKAEAEPTGAPQLVRLEGKGMESLELSAPGTADALLLRICLIRRGVPAARQRLEAMRLTSLRAAPAAAPAAAPSFAVAQPHACLRYRLACSASHLEVRVTIGVASALGIARREGNVVGVAVGTSTTGSQVLTFGGRLDELLLYVPQAATSLEICADLPVDPAAEEREWGSEPYLARGIQVPARSVNPALGGAADELALATSRLVGGELLDPARFADVARTLNDSAAQAARVSPVLRTTQMRDAADDLFLEVRAWPLALALLARPAWRRALGFGYLDRGVGLVPGDLYDYRITGYFRQRDVGEFLFGFHTVPTGIALPPAFQLGPVRLSTIAPAAVELLPSAGAGALRSTGRKGVRLDGAQRLTLEFPAPITRLTLELEAVPGHSLRYEATTTTFIFGLPAGTVDLPVPADPRVELAFADPVDTVVLSGVGFVYALRFATGTPPDDIVPVSVVLPGVRYEATALPASPPFLGTTNLQQAPLVGDPQITTRTPPQAMGFELAWLPPPPSGLPPLLPWPADLDAGPPFDVLGFQLERRRVDVPDAFAPVDDDGDPDTLFGGHRGSRGPSTPLAYGADLLELFPETPRPIPPVHAFLSAPDVLVSEETGGPPPGSLHQYRLFAVDMLGRRSAPRVGSVVRLEKRRPPPQPVGPGTVPPPGAIVPGGVRARVLQASDPELSPEDVATLGAGSNAIMLEWGWTGQERGRDPYAREFRVYWQPVPPDEVPGSLTGAATLVGGRWQIAATMDRTLSANAMRGSFLRSGGRPFRVAGHAAGAGFAVELEPSLIRPPEPPAAGAFVFRPVLDGSELRPAAWSERVDVLAIGAPEQLSYVLRDRLTLDAAHPRARVWVGVSTADDQTYVPDERAAATTNGGRPGNESSIAAVVVEARYLGRPAFVVPPPLPDVPERVTREPTGDTVTATIDLPALLPGVVVPAGHRVVIERVGFDALVTRIGARPDDRIRVTFPDETATDYALANPGDQADFLQQIRAGVASQVEGRFLMDFLLRFPVELDTLWRRALAEPVAFGPITDTLPSQTERHVHRARLVDAAGHVSEGAAIVPQILRVASLRMPRAPELVVVGDATDALTVRAAVADAPDLRWLVLFRLADDAAAAFDARTLERAQLLRLPDRRDLYPNDGLRLRLADGSLLAPAAAVDLTSAGVLEPPLRRVSAQLPVGFDRRAAVWAVTLTRDGIPSRFAGPMLAMAGAAPLVVPALTVTAVAPADRASWSVLAAGVDVALERSTDDGATWSRLSPWLSHLVQTLDVPGLPGARSYRLVLRASRGRAAAGAAVTPS